MYAHWNRFKGKKRKTDDKFNGFYALRRNTEYGKDYQVSVNDNDSDITFMAIHGGGIEPGTSEIVNFLAGKKYNSYSFDGLRKANNSHLHLTSRGFNEKEGLRLAWNSDIIFSIHGCKDNVKDGKTVSTREIYMGGGSKSFMLQVAGSLALYGFVVRFHGDETLSGESGNNIANKGNKPGIQIELPMTIRKEFFEDWNEGKKKPSKWLKAFKNAIHHAINVRHLP